MDFELHMTFSPFAAFLVLFLIPLTLFIYVVYFCFGFLFTHVSSTVVDVCWARARSEFLVDINAVRFIFSLFFFCVSFSTRICCIRYEITLLTFSTMDSECRATGRCHLANNNL